MMAQIADITSIHTGEQLLPESLRQFAVRLILLVCSIVLVWTIVPALFSLQVLLALAAFTILLVISRDRFRAVLAAPALSAVRMLFFLVLECAVPILSKGHLRGAADASARGFLTPILRLAVLVPGLVLFPFAFWRRVAAVFRAECVAALLALFTLFPYRLAVFLWTHAAANGLAQLIYFCIAPFSANAFYRAAPAPVVGTHHYAVKLIFECSGMQGVFLFQALFGVIVLWDWKRIVPQRALIVYLSGVVTMQFANVLRILGMVTAGNFLEKGVVERYHVNAGWILFSLAFLIFESLTYRWMLRENSAPGVSLAAGYSSANSFAKSIS